jgi:MFS transporter, CP family, cyanate transporter
VNRRAVGGILALFVVGLALRTQLAVIGPLLVRIQGDLGIVHATAGLLTGLPLLCMGLAAFVAPRITSRVGPRLAVSLGLFLVGLAGLARAASADVATIFSATLIIGLGIGIGGATVPVFIKQRFGGRPASVTGMHVTGVILGSTLIASVAVPLADAFDSWRGSLAATSAMTLGAAALWLILSAGQRDAPSSHGPRPRWPVRAPITWLLVALFCLQTLLFFGLATWLPAAYVERGWQESAAAGLVAVLIAAGLPATFSVGWLADRVGSRRTYFVTGSAVALVCCLGFLVVPGAAWAWAFVVGIPLGALFSLAMTLPLDVARSPADVGPLTGLMLGVGYSFAAVTPVAMGAVRDAVGSFTLSLGLLAVAAGVLMALSFLLTDKRLHAGAVLDERIHLQPGFDAPKGHR